MKTARDAAEGRDAMSETPVNDRQCSVATARGRTRQLLLLGFHPWRRQDPKTKPQVTSGT